MIRLSCLLWLLVPSLALAQVAPPTVPATPVATPAAPPVAAQPVPAIQAVPATIPPVSPHATCQTAMTTPFKNYAAAVDAMQKLYPSHRLFTETHVSCGPRHALVFLFIDYNGVLPARIVAVDLKSIGSAR